MAGPRGVAQWPRAKPVTRVDGRALVQQFGRQGEAIRIRRRKQRQRHLDGRDLRFRSVITTTELLAPFRLGGESSRDGAEYSDRDRAQKQDIAVQAAPSSTPNSSLHGMTASLCQVAQQVASQKSRCQRGP